MLSVILCTYNRAAVLRGTLRSLGALRGAATLPWELIVVDNHSTDATRDTIDAFRRTRSLPLVSVFEARQGKSHALNTGLAHARGDIVAFTDDDVTLDAQWLVEVARAFARPACQAIGGRIVPVWSSPPPPWFSSRGPHRLAQAIVEFDLGEEPIPLSVPPFGANLAFRRALFDEHGGFRTDLGPRPGKFRLGGGGEDTEFCRRLMGRGVPILYAPRAVVYHPVEPERMTKQYFKRWYFQYGQSLARQSEIPHGAPRCWGVPLYLLRELTATLLRAQCSLRPAPRFHYLLEAYRMAGQISEHFCAARRVGAPVPAASQPDNS